MRTSIASTRDSRGKRAGMSGMLKASPEGVKRGGGKEIVALSGNSERGNRRRTHSN